MQQPPPISGKLFLAEQRGVLETPAFRRYSTFEFGAYAHPHKQPFGRLQALNEETLAGGQSVSFCVATAAVVLVVPITGAVWAGTQPGVAALVEVAELHALPVVAGRTVQFTNPYETELIHFLHIWLRPAVAALPGAGQHFTLDLPGQPNQLVAACLVVPAPVPGGHAGAAPLPFRVCMGQFAGRAEAQCRPASDHPVFFAFVLAGAFEVEGRLLHAGDGLGLCHATAVELEALSNHAVILTLELAA